jgi:threonine/homoserine/homoserine lactone efflux protein
VDYGLLKLGIVLGLGAAAPIGPVNVEIARRTLRGGFVPGFALGCGAVSVDVLYAVLSSQGLQRVLDRPAVYWTLGVGGIAVLLYLSALCFRAAWRARRVDPLTVPTTSPEPGGAAGGAPMSDPGREPNGGPAPAAPAGTARGAYGAGVLMTLLNPLTLAFWFVAVPGTLGPITEEPRAHLPMICAGVFLGTLGWVVAFAGTLALAGRYRRAWWTAAADAAGGATLLAFALAALWRLARPFI